MWVFSLARTGNSQVCDSLFRSWKQLCHTQLTELILWTWLTGLPKSVDFCQSATSKRPPHQDTNTSIQILWNSPTASLLKSSHLLQESPQGRKGQQSHWRRHRVPTHLLKPVRCTPCHQWTTQPEVCTSLLSVIHRENYSLRMAGGAINWFKWHSLFNINTPCHSRVFLINFFDSCRELAKSKLSHFHICQNKSSYCLLNVVISCMQ